MVFWGRDSRGDTIRSAPATHPRSRRRQTATASMGGRNVGRGCVFPCVDRKIVTNTTPLFTRPCFSTGYRLTMCNQKCAPCTNLCNRSSSCLIREENSHDVVVRTAVSLFSSGSLKPCAIEYLPTHVPQITGVSDSLECG